MKLTIISRENWKARKSKVVYTPNHPKIIIIHHEGAGNPKQKVASSFKGIKTIQAIQNFHMDNPKRLWQDIAYSAIIAPNGDIYQGRPFDAVGAHTKGHNTGSIGICIIGNFEVEVPTEEQLKSLKNLIIHLTTLFPVLDVPKCLFGHKDFANTDCPGKNLYPIIFDWKTGKNKFFTI